MYQVHAALGWRPAATTLITNSQRHGIVTLQFAQPSRAGNQSMTHPLPISNFKHLSSRRNNNRLQSISSSRCSPTVLAGAANSNNDINEAAMLPDSREEAIAQACAAIAANLPVSKGKKKSASAAPGFQSASRKLSVEIPVADESESAAISLASEIIAGLSAPWNSQFTIVAPTTNPSSSSAARVVSLDACLSQEDSSASLGSCIIIAAPKTDKIEAVELLLGRWNGAVVILLNAEWAPAGGEDDAGVPPQHTAFARSFDTVYCFMPLLIKAFVVNTQEGAVFRFSGSADGASPSARKNKTSSGFGGGQNSGGQDEQQQSSGGAPWRIFMRQGNSWEAVARMQRRPSSTDVEVSFYNASAANSPLTKGAKFIKGLVGDKKKK